MKIVSHVYFVLEMVEPAEHKYQEIISHIDNDGFVRLQRQVDYIHLLSKVPCAFNLMRKVSLQTEDHHSLNLVDGADITTDSFKFIIANKVPYMADLRQYLSKNLEKYSSDNFITKGTEVCQEVHFKNFAQFSTKKPIFFTGPYEYNGTLLPDEPLKNRPLTVRPLTDKDIVLNKQLNQIWPIATNEPPKELVALLAKTKEEIR